MTCRHASALVWLQSQTRKGVGEYRENLYSCNGLHSELPDVVKTLTTRRFGFGPTVDVNKIIPLRDYFSPEWSARCPLRVGNPSAVAIHHEDLPLFPPNPGSPPDAFLKRDVAELPPQQTRATHAGIPGTRSSTLHPGPASVLRANRTGSLSTLLCAGKATLTPKNSGIARTSRFFQVSFEDSRPASIWRAPLVLTDRHARACSPRNIGLLRSISWQKLLGILLGASRFAPYIISPGGAPYPSPSYPDPERTAEPESTSSFEQVPSPTDAPAAPSASGPSEPPTPQPTSEPDDGYSWYPSPSHNPAPSRPSDEPAAPKVSTLAPATFAPSVSYAPEPDCGDPVAAFGQCGGVGYDGPKCCRQGYECVSIADCFAEVRAWP